VIFPASGKGEPGIFSNSIALLRNATHCFFRPALLLLGEKARAENSGWI